MFKRVWELRIVRFVASGGPGTWAYFIVFWMLGWVFGKTHYLVWGTMASTANYSLDYVLQLRFTFGHDPSRSTRQQVIAYVFLAFFLTAVNDTMLWLLIGGAGFWYEAAPFITGIVLAVITYVVQRKFFAADRMRGS